MVENSEVLARGANRISLVSVRQATTQEDYLAIAERALPVGAIEQIWIFGVGDTTRIGRKTSKLANIFLGIVNWLNHLGGRKIDESRLEARHSVHHNVKTNGVRF